MFLRLFLVTTIILLGLYLIYKRYKTSTGIDDSTASVLVYYHNKENYVSYYITNTAKSLRAMLKSSRNYIHLKFHWTINNITGETTIPNALAFAGYLSKTNRIVVVTVDAVWLVDPSSGKKKAFEFDRKYRFFPCKASDDMDFIYLLGSYLIDDANDVIVGIIVDIKNNDYSVVELPDRVYGVFGIDRDSYYVTSKKTLYKVQSSSVQVCREFEPSHQGTVIIGIWENQPIFSYWDQDDFEVIELSGVTARSYTCFFNKIFLTNYVWLINAEGKLEIYDGSKLVFTENLDKEVKGTGKLPNGGVWIYYIDKHVEERNPEGKIIKEHHLENII